MSQTSPLSWKWNEFVFKQYFTLYVQSLSLFTEIYNSSNTQSIKWHAFDVSIYWGPLTHCVLGGLSGTTNVKRKSTNCMYKHVLSLQFTIFEYDDVCKQNNNYNYYIDMWLFSNQHGNTQSIWTSNIYFQHIWTNCVKTDLKICCVSC